MTGTALFICGELTFLLIAAVFRSARVLQPGRKTLFVRGKTSFPVGAALSRHLVRCKTSETAVHLAFAAALSYANAFSKGGAVRLNAQFFLLIYAPLALVFEVSHSLAVCVK